MLIQVEYTQILSSLTIITSTKAKMFLSHVMINKQITPKGSRERHWPLNELPEIHLQTKANDCNSPHSLANKWSFHEIIFLSLPSPDDTSL